MYRLHGLLQVAQDLDAMEHKLMASQGMHTSDFIKFAAEDSGNVASDGMFSIQACSLPHVACKIVELASKHMCTAAWTTQDTRQSASCASLYNAVSCLMCSFACRCCRKH